jgi:hypothetical protein
MGQTPMVLPIPFQEACQVPKPTMPPDFAGFRRSGAAGAQIMVQIALPTRRNLRILLRFAIIATAAQ